jgi:hypothetical protein
MPCPTCAHPMRAAGENKVATLFWCPRCGTLCEDCGVNGFATAPKLVERCREYQDQQIFDPKDAAEWHRLGITESIQPPERRPAP